MQREILSIRSLALCEDMALWNAGDQAQLLAGALEREIKSSGYDALATSMLAAMLGTVRQLEYDIRRLSKGGFNPNQPRVPAGNPEGGQWTTGAAPASSLNTSEKGFGFIAHKEGFSSEIYKDKAGYPTIGYGHKLLSGEAYPNGVNHKEALDILKSDTRIAEQAVQGYVRVKLTQYQFDALVSFTFNVGNDSFRTSTLLQLLNSGDYNGAADQFPRWNKITENGIKKPDKGLTNRRKAERNLFLHNRY